MECQLFKVIDIHPGDLWFWSCPNCMRKMSVVGKLLLCSDCNEGHQKSPVYRKYKLSLKVANLSSRRVSQLTIFGRSLDDLFGCEADLLAKLVSFEPTDVLSELKDILLGCKVSVNITKYSGGKGWSYPQLSGYGLQLYSDDSCHNVFYRLKAKSGSCLPTSKQFISMRPLSSLTVSDPDRIRNIHKLSTNIHESDNEVAAPIKGEVPNKGKESDASDDECELSSWYESLILEVSPLPKADKNTVDRSLPSVKESIRRRSLIPQHVKDDKVTQYTTPKRQKLQNASVLRFSTPEITSTPNRLSKISGESKRVEANDTSNLNVLLESSFALTPLKENLNENSCSRSDAAVITDNQSADLFTDLSDISYCVNNDTNK